MRPLKTSTATDSASSDSAEPTPDETPPPVSSEDHAQVDIDTSDHQQQQTTPHRRSRWRQVIVYCMLPALALLLTAAAGFLKWHDTSVRDAQTASAESQRAATEGTVALLSYKPDTVEKDLASAKNRLTGTFLAAYTNLTHDVVIPGAKQKQISAEATVPAGASISATPNHAVVLLFVNQTVTIGQSPPTNTASSVRVTLDKIGGRWLISQFDPV
jgi:Mce-associated membrane protein